MAGNGWDWWGMMRNGEELLEQFLLFVADFFFKVMLLDFDQIYTNTTKITLVWNVYNIFLTVHT